MGKNIAYYNLTGGLNTMQGLGTINQSNNRTESPDMLNIEYYKLGGLKTMEGNTQVGSKFAAAITLGFEYIFGNDSYLIVTTADGKVFIYDKTIQDFREIYQFKTATNRHSIVSFNNGIIISNGVDDLVYYIYGRHDLLSGNVTGNLDGNTITGVGSKFTTELAVGDRIEVGTNIYQVATITSDTEMTVTPNIVEAFTDSDYYLTEISECNAVLTNSNDENINQPIRGLALASYKGRIWVGANDGTLYYSELGLIHGWDVKYDAGGIPQFYDDNSDFTALGNWSEYLTIHKREQTYILDATNADSGNWAIKPYSDYTCDSQQGYVVANNGYYVFSRAAGGIYAMLSRSLYNTLYQAGETSAKIRDSFKYLNTSQYDKIFPVYHPKKKYLMFYVPMLFGTGSNDCYIFDIQTKSWLHRQVTQNVTIAFQFDKKVYIGTADGLILEEFSGTSFNGEPIEFFWKSPFFTWGGGTNWTTTREFRVKLSEEKNTKCLLRTYRDGQNIPRVRPINNKQTNLLSLVWDIGYNKSDIVYNEDNPQAKILPIYKLLGSNGITYYSINLPDDNTPVKLYSDENCTQFVNYSNLITELVDGTEDDYNYIDYTPVKSYAYARITNSTKPSYQCYKSTEDPRVLAWINPTNTGTAYITLKKQTQRVIDFYGYKFRHIGGVGGVTVSYGIGLKNPSYWTDGVTRQYPDVGIFSLDVNGNGTFPNTYYSGFNYYGNMSTVKCNGNKQINYQLYSASSSMPEMWLDANGEFTRKPEWDTYKNVTTYVYNGSTSIDDTNVFNTSNYSNTSVVINGVTYNRYNSGDIINTSENIVWIRYTTENPLEVGNMLYKDIKCTLPYVEVKSIEDDVYYLDDEKQISCLRYPQGDNEFNTEVYKKKQPITYTIDDTFEHNIPNPEYYEYPTDGYSDNLTDTVWDENSWYKSSHITKRFPLADQYFQSLQIEFYGNSLEDNLMIYGFEVDGVQLTEVTW